MVPQLQRFQGLQLFEGGWKFALSIAFLNAGNAYAFVGRLGVLYDKALGQMIALLLLRLFPHGSNPRKGWLDMVWNMEFNRRGPHSLGKSVEWKHLYRTWQCHVPTQTVPTR